MYKGRVNVSGAFLRAIEPFGYKSIANLAEDLIENWPDSSSRGPPKIKSLRVILYEILAYRRSPSKELVGALHTTLAPDFDIKEYIDSSVAAQRAYGCDPLLGEYITNLVGVYEEAGKSRKLELLRGLENLLSENGTH